ncbi:MAG: hypothetical protein R3C99_20970 [Pirellulaceae bacterium]
MTDTAHASSESTGNPSAEPAKSSPARLIVLVVLLGLVVFAFYYDRKVAKAGSEAGYDKVMVLVDKKNQQPADAPPVTDADVIEALGFQPAKETKSDHYTEQVFAWRRGLPVLSWPVFVYYTHGKDGKLHLFSTTLHEAASPGSLPGGVIMAPPMEGGATDPAEAQGMTPPGTPPGAGGDTAPEGDAPPSEETASPENPTTSEDQSSTEEQPAETSPPADDSEAKPADAGSELDSTEASDSEKE